MVVILHAKRKKQPRYPHKQHIKNRDSEQEDVVFYFSFPFKHQLFTLVNDDPLLKKKYKIVQVNVRM